LSAVCAVCGNLITSFSVKLGTVKVAISGDKFLTKKSEVRIISLVCYIYAITSTSSEY